MSTNSKKFGRATRPSKTSNEGGVPVYVRLLNEGTDVSRPTEALDLGNGLFELLPTSDYDPENETWEFPPGSLVLCEKHIGSIGEYLLASGLVRPSR
jgi:hypothetical protein